jgi:hypothetical protein
VQAQWIGEGAAHGLAWIERRIGVLKHHLHAAGEAAAIVMSSTMIVPPVVGNGLGINLLLL